MKMVITMEQREFGNYLARVREQAGFKSQRQLALEAGISPATLSRIESGIQKAQPETLKKLSTYLKTSYELLMERAGYIDESEPPGTLGRAPDQNPLGIELSADELEFLRDLQNNPDTMVMFRNFAGMTPDERKTFLDLMMMYGKKNKR